MTVSARRTVVVAALTYKRQEMLAKLLRSLPSLERPADWDVRFLIVDNDPDGSARATVDAAAAEFGGLLVYVAEAELGIPFARNRAIAEAIRSHAALLAFIDDDDLPDNRWLVNIVAHQERTGADLVGGPQMASPPDDARLGLRQTLLCKSMVRRSSVLRQQAKRRAERGGSNLVATNNWLASVDWLEKEGLRFDERMRLSGGSDAAMFLAAQERGARIGWCDSAVVYEPQTPHRLSLRYQLHRAVAQGIVQSNLHPRPIVIAIPQQLARIATGLGLWVVPVFGYASIVMGARRVGMGIGFLAGTFGTRSRLYARK